MTHAFSTQRMNSDSGLSDVADGLKNKDSYKNGKFAYLTSLSEVKNYINLLTTASKFSDE